MSYASFLTSHVSALRCVDLALLLPDFGYSLFDSKRVGSRWLISGAPPGGPLDQDKPCWRH
jgi:hypothetical protein